jgi:hypothetical protein
MFTPFERLWDLDLACFKWVIEKLKLSFEVEFSQAFEKDPGSGINDLRNKFKPSNRQQQVLPVYQQVFDPFETNLSILDLLFNLGPQSTEWLLKQYTKESNYQ